MTETTDSCASSTSSNSTSSVGSPPVDLEEGENVTGEKDYGYFPAHLGQCLEKGRYCIVRKLGWGCYSSVWLARDRTQVFPVSTRKGANAPFKYYRDEKFVSLKILNREAIEMLEKGKSDEVGLLRTIAGSNPSHRGFRHNLLYYDTFKLKSWYGEHQCIVTEVLGPSIDHIFKVGKDKKAQRHNAVRSITRQILMALEYLHNECHIVHTDIKMDNILFRLKHLDDVIVHQLAMNPSCISYCGPMALQPEVPIIMSQPLFTTDMLESESLEVVLADVGHSHRRFHPLCETVQPVGLRAPEVILGAEWDTPIDIWNLGCIVTELCTGGDKLFDVAFLTINCSYEETHLACMTKVAQTNFDLEFLNKCKNKLKYFKEDGTFAHFTKHRVPPETVKAVLATKDSIIDDERDREMAERFILRCLQLVPENRPTATELLEDPWLQNIKA